MKLKNKYTGDTLEWDGDLCLCNRGKYGETLEEHHYNSLAKLNREWEDYVPEDAYFLQHDGLIDRFRRDDLEEEKEIGNYFETEKEAELAVKKLKAWKRLKDLCQFSFNGIITNSMGKVIGVKVKFNGKSCTMDESGQAWDDLDLLFRGEE